MASSETGTLLRDKHQENFVYMRQEASGILVGLHMRKRDPKFAEPVLDPREIC